MVKKMQEKVKSLFSGGFFHIFLGNTLVKMIAFISSIVIVRLVNKQDYAYLAYADNLYNYVIAFAGLGMNSAILKYCAVAKTKEEDKAYFSFAMKYGTLFEMGLTVIVIIYVTFARIPFPEARIIVYLLVFYPIITNILNTVLGYLRAHGQNQLYAKAAVIQTAFIFVLSVVLVNVLGVAGIAFSRYIAISVAVLCGAGYIYRYHNGVKPKKLSRKEIGMFMEMSVSLMISNLFSLIMPMNEMTLVNEILRDEILTANYKIAIMIPGQLAFVSQSIIIYYFTIIAKTQDRKEVWKLSKRIGAVTAVLILGITCVGMILTPWIIRFVYGAHYEDAISLSMVFWGVYALNAAIRLVPMNFLPAIGVTKFNAVMAGVSCVVHVLITYISISRFGIYGAGIATGIVYVASGISYWVYYRRKCLRKE